MIIMSDQIDIETDQYFLHNVVNDTGSQYIASIIKQRFDNIIAYKAIDFKSNVFRIINECLQKHGIPMFRTKYAGQPFPGNSALMVCYGSHDGRMRGVWFKDIPEEDLRALESKQDGYHQILRKYTTGDKIMPYIPNYGNNVQANQFNIKCNRDTALRELKVEIEKAIPDEADAQKMYERMAALAMSAGLNDKAILIDLIKSQENNHEMIFRDMLKHINGG